LYRRNSWPGTKAAYLDVLNTLLVRYAGDTTLNSGFAILDIQLDCSQTASLARAQAFYLVIRDTLRAHISDPHNEQSEPWIEVLARERPNLCAIVLQDLAQASTIRSSLGNSATLLKSLIRVATCTEDNELLAIAYDLLARAMEHDRELKLPATLVLGSLPGPSRMSMMLAPSAVAGTVRVSGFILDSCFESAFTEEMSRALRGLFYRIRIMIHENSVSISIIIILLC